MPNEYFDKLVREQLETLQTAPDQERWNQFRSQLPAPTQAGWWTRAGGWVSGGLAAAAMVGVLLWFAQLEQKIDRLGHENRLLRTTRPPTAAAVLPPAPIRTDTVYVIKRTVVEHHYHDFPKPSQLFTSSEDLARQLPVRDSGRIRTALSAVPAGSTEQLPAPPTDSLPPPTTTPVVAGREEQKLAAYSKASAADTVPSKPPFRFSSLHPRLGLESGVVSHGVWSVGPAVEFFFSDNLTLATGVLIAQQRAKNHQKLGSFNSDTGKDFEQLYRPYLPERYDQIDEIRIQTSAVSVPLHLKYYTPLRRNWALAFSVGTVLDASVYQTVRFESILAGKEKLNTFEVNARNKVFHNLVFGTGVQYQRGRLSASVSPFVLYDFRDTDYSATGGKVGLKGSVWLNLYP